MTPTLHVDRCVVRCRLRADESAVAERLERLHREVGHEALEGALRAAGIPEDEEVLIRRIRVPVRLALSRPDAVLVGDWATKIAAEVRRLLAGRGSGEVVCYRSRREALVDMTVGVARGDFEAAWAWARLFHFDESAPSESLTRALVREPSAIVPIVREVSRRGTLPALVRLLGADDWIALATLAWEHVGAGAPLGIESGTPSPEAPDDLARRAVSGALRSAIGRAALAIAAGAVDAASRSALAALALLDAEPALPRVAGAAAPSLAAQVAEALFAAEAPSVPKAPSAPEAPSIPDALQPEGRAVERDLREEGMTDVGGLLFALRVIGDLELPGEILRDAVFRDRSLRWVLHRVGMALSGAGARDAAVLAFAGLSPKAEAPEEESDRVERDAERSAIAALVERVTRRFADVLGLEESRKPLVEIFRRRARIVADPGWIEAILSLDDVSLDVRRSGLDIDPGYVPWLGVVVRFVYV